MKKKYIIVVLAALTVLIPMMTLVAMAADPTFGNVQFKNKWLTQDRLVGSPDVQRPYTWGPSVPEALTAIAEPYAEAPGGMRQVQYFDKARMELNNPATGFVTAGLVVKELVTGQRQDGDNTFTQRSASKTQIAGDTTANGGNPDVPSYSSFANLVTLGNTDSHSQPSAIGNIITASVDKTGLVGTITPPEQISVSAFEAVTGHNIAKPFQDFKFINGPTTDPVSNSRVENQPIYTNDPTTNVFGYAISDPYWVKARVAGVDRVILVQLFQRRVLTYNPTLSGSAVQKVEMGNVGQHYYQWRYVENTTPTPTPVTTTPATTTPASTPVVPNDYTQKNANYNKAGGGLPAGTELTYNAGAAINSSAAVDPAKNLAVIGTTGGGLQGVNLTSQANAFTFKPSTGTVNFGESVLYNGTLYTSGGDGRVYSIDENASGSNVTEKAKTGLPAVGGPVVGSVAISPDAAQLYYTVGTSIYAVDLATLTNQKWVRAPGGNLTAPVVDSAGIVYFGSDNGNLYAYKPDGTAVTGYPVTVGTPLKGITPTLANGNIYVGGDNGVVYKYNTANATPVWNRPLTTLADINTTIAVAGGSVFVGTDGNQVYKLDDANGSIMSTFTAPNKIQSSPAVVDGFYYFGDLAGNFYKVDVGAVSNFTKLLTSPNSFGSNSPVVNGGKVYIGDVGGILHIIK